MEVTTNWSHIFMENSFIKKNLRDKRSKDTKEREMIEEGIRTPGPHQIKHSTMALQFDAGIL